MLIYAKGGYTKPELISCRKRRDDRSNPDIDTDGFRVGAGAEYAMGTNSLR